MKIWKRKEDMNKKGERGKRKIRMGKVGKCGREKSRDVRKE